MLHLTHWCNNDWSFVGEGNANIVLRYLGNEKEWIGKVLRIKKGVKFQLSDAEYSQQFNQRIITRLLGSEFVLQYEIVKVSFEFLKAMMSSIQRPEARLDTGVDLGSTAALVLKDLTQFMTVELKPKWGFKPCSEFIKHLDIKTNHCRFCMHSHYRQLDIGDYCPLDLYSSERLRVGGAIRSLLVSADLKKTLKVSVGSRSKEEIEEILTEVFIQDPLLCKLKKLQQSLDSLDIEGILPLYEKYKPDRLSISAWEEVVQNYIKGSSQGLQKIYEYVLSMTFKDCSIIVSLKQVEFKGPKTIQIKGQYIEYDSKVIDVDCKDINKIPYWFELDKKIIENALNSKFNKLCK
ncbi:inositol-pentakisphosphate 2-kinase [Sporodiniella umbellata]|nr:inositol-pentakisphosphate 2-kinase [Sporodiniella umbellata]